MPWPLRTTRPFGCSQLEALFRHQCVHRSAGDLLRTLCVLVPMQLLMAVWRVPQPGPVLLWLAGSAATGLALAVALACSPPSTQHPLLPLGALWLCSGPLLLSSLWPAHALLPSLAAIFLLYAFFLQFGRFRTMLCFILSSAQFVAMLYGDFGLAKMAAIVLAHVWAHVAGIYALSTGRKISRRAFLNARNALDGENELQTEIGRMGKLLSGALPPHIVESVQTQLGGSEVPRVFVEHFGHCSVVIARLYGLPSILAQLPVPDSARLLNEFDWRLRSLVDASGLLMVPTQAESILVLSGVPSPTPIHASAACQFGVDLLAMVHSFCAATGAQLQVRVGIGSGSLSAGIVGARRWHYDVLGMALDAAVHLEANCAVGGILLSEDCWRLLGNKFPAERVAQGAWQVSVVPPEFASSTVRPLLFPEPPRRFSLQTPQQAILRLLQQQPPRPVRTSPCAVCPPVVPTTPFTKRSKHGGAKSHGCVPQRVGSCRQLDSLLGPMPTGLGPFGLRFADSRLEAAFHAQPDRWLIPGLALCVLFLALFGLFQALAMPRMLPNLATLGLALGLMFLLLLALYVNFLESFCQFVTRTALGHAVAVLLVLAALLTCGLANTFSCPLDTFSTVCRPQQFPAVSLALWMLLTTVFIRLWALLLLPVLFASIGLFGLHLFWSHPSLYPDPIGRLDLLAGLCALAVLLFLLARRNQMQLRMDFLALVKTLEDGRQLERAEFLCDQILLNALPAHIAFNFAARTEPYAHLCPSVGLLVARLGRSGDWVGEFGFDRLNRLVCEIDQQLGKLSERRLEKVQTGHCYYTAACGVHDTPCTIGEQLATLAQLAEFIQELADSEGLDVAVGLDCGAALSTVIGGDRPRYELLGQPVTRARKLAEAASALGGACVLLSEDVFLALRPRAQFHFDERNALSVGPGLVAYSLLRTPQPAPSPPPPPPPAHQQQQKDELESPPPPPPHRPPIQVRANPLADGRALAISTSAQSLCSSELFSVDLSVETDSLELEWVTPEMVANGQYRPFPEPTTNCYKADRAGFYSELSVAESHQQLNGFGKTTAETNGSGAPKRWAKRLAKSRRSSTGANTSAFGSELSLPGGAHPLDRLNLAAKKVDRMLKEMAGIQGPDPPPECPFPREWDMTTTANSAGIRPASRAPSGGCGCLSEYENNDNDNGGSRPSLAFGSEMGSSTSRLDRLRRALLLAASRGRGVNTNGRRLGQQERGDGNEADRSCSPSMGGSSHFLPCSSRAAKARALLGARWRRSSAHSIGYEDEYELASAPLSSYSSSAVSLGWPSTSGKQQQLPSVGEHSQFAPIDADMEEIPVGTNAVMLDEHVGDGLETTGDGCCVRNQMLELSRDIRRNFGDFQLASFPDGQAKE